MLRDCVDWGLWDNIMKSCAPTGHRICDFTFTVDELKTFIGILLFSGYHIVLRDTMG